ncbi:hypothetical protein J4573_21100 [Actinomadura barringtoniae]|uniref:DUF6924 domain-containing protein n=1 Tax=Actinomadura barringtoniae TaxID=1427535 RepID=A0A939PCD3_9ACTN|nr:hypothetical protein [Actinomadura barringtoniae]MBO2449612.1 hypothetical protein [Actinomadura barringtoniae]
MSDPGTTMRAMTFPELFQSAPGEVLLVCTSYENGKARWGQLLGEIGGGRQGDVLVLGDARVRLVEGRGWDYLHGGNVPALVPEGESAPVVVLADIAVTYGGAGPLLVDVAVVPGRGVRVPSARLGEVLTALLGGALGFDDLVRGMDVLGVYEGDGARPAFTTPTTPLRRDFPALPSTDAALLVRTSFDDEAGWQALLADLGGVDESGRWVGADLDPDEIDVDNYPLTARVVDDRAFSDLLPGQVPALTAPKLHTTLVALADARTFTEPGRPLTVVDLYDTPGQAMLLPCREVGSLACNLEIGNMDFHEFIAQEGEEPWWKE